MWSPCACTPFHELSLSRHIAHRDGNTASYQRKGPFAVLQPASRLIAHRSALRPFPLRHRSTIFAVAVDDTEAAMTRLRTANVARRHAQAGSGCRLILPDLEEEIDRVAELIGSA